MTTNLRGVSPLERYPDYARAIGMITVEMGALEASCVLLLAVVMQTTEAIANAIMMTPQSTRARLEILENVASEVLSHKEAKRVKELSRKCAKALNERNSVVHEIWGVGESGVTRIPIPHGDPKPIDIKELLDQLDKLRRLADKVEVLRDDLKNRAH